MTGHEGPGIETWIYGLLSADATVQAACGGATPRVYQGHVPQGVTAFPCVVFLSQGDEPDTRPVGRFRILGTRHYLVKAIDKAASVLGIAGLANRLDALLDGTNGQALSTTILACVREHAVDYPETDQGVEYRHLGAVYRIQAQQTGS